MMSESEKKTSGIGLLFKRSLLNKRLARSLWRTKLRLFAVVFMVSVGVFAGITFGGYSHNLDGMYETMHADDSEGANLADLWIDNRSAIWSGNQVDDFCQHLITSWNNSITGELDSCEGRTIIQGAMFHNNSTGEHIINSLWHGIPANANSDRVWMPEGHSKGQVAMAADEIVIDAFAGIGYYSLPMLVRSNVKHLHACEINPNSIEALSWAAKKNNVSHKLTIHEGDNKIALANLRNISDRCHLGILPSSESVWKPALECLKSDGGWLHIHMNVAEEKISSWAKETISKLKIISKELGRNWNIEVKNIEKVKWYAPRIRHVVLDVHCHL